MSSSVKTFVVIVKKDTHAMGDWYTANDEVYDLIKQYSEFTQYLVTNIGVNVTKFNVRDDADIDKMTDKLRKLQNKYQVRIHLFDVYMTWSWI